MDQGVLVDYKIKCYYTASTVFATMIWESGIMHNFQAWDTYNCFLPTSLHIHQKLEQKYFLSTKGLYGYFEGEMWFLEDDVLDIQDDKEVELLEHVDYHDPFLQILHMRYIELLKGRL